MSSITNLPPEIIMEIFEYLPPYELLDNIQDVCVAWRELVQRLPLWHDFVYPEDVDFRTVPYNKHINVIKLFEKCPMLKHIGGCTNSYRDDHQDREEFVTAVIDNCSDILSFNVDFRWKCLNLSQLERLCQAFPNLESLRVGIECEKHVKELVKFTKLKKLTVAKLRYSNGLFKPVVDGCTFLEYLSFENASWMSENDLLYILHNMKDRLLGLQFGSSQIITQQAVSVLGSFTKLEDLVLSHAANGLLNYLPLANVRTLKCFTFSSSTEEAYKWETLFDVLFQNPFPSLQKLNISADSRQCNRPVLKDICRSYPKLKLLHLSYHLADDMKDTFTDIVGLDSLESFAYTCSKTITDDDTEQIAKCSKLKHVNLCLGRRLTDKTVMNLTKCKYLQTLNLSLCSLTPHSLSLFPQHFKRLRLLHIAGLKLNEADFNLLAEKLPFVRIQHY